MKDELSSAPPLGLIKKDCSLRNFNSWRVGGSADYFAQPGDIDELRAAASWALDVGLPLTVLSGGSNVLIRDGGVRGLVISMRSLTQISSQRRSDRLEVVAESGCRKAQVFRIFLKAQLAPAEFLSGIPGDIGGGVVMNAGVSESIRPREFAEIVDWIEYVDLGSEDLPLVKKSGTELGWSYRSCVGWQPGIIYRVGLSWPDEPDADLPHRVSTSSQSRKDRQPLDLPSCGSVFVNPEGDKAGRLIESCGLKGKFFGGAQVSEKHANFIVNRGSATATDIESAIYQVQAEVHRAHGVLLKTEVVFLGDGAAAGP